MVGNTTKNARNIFDSAVKDRSRSLRTGALLLFVSALALTSRAFAADSAPVTVTPTDIFNSLKDWSLLWVVLIAAVVGFLGGAIHVWSGADHDLVGNLTFWQSGLLGSLTSICVYFVVTPNVGIKFIALSLIAGYGGKLIMDGLVNRAKLAVSQQENAKKDKKLKSSNVIFHDLAKLTKNHQDILNHPSIQYHKVTLLKDMSFPASDEVEKLEKKWDDLMV